MGDLAWGGQLAVDHDDAFVHLEVPTGDGASVITLDPDVARRIGRALIVHAEQVTQVTMSLAAE